MAIARAMRALVAPSSVVLAMLMLAGGAWAAEDEPVLDAARIAAARTAADHLAIAQAYEDAAAALSMRATSHESMARAYRAMGPAKAPNPQALAAHCGMLAKQYAEAAHENRKLAELHRALARSVGK